ncbi:A/G-specific adenine glycosylase [Flavihumibacter sediminis]|nr:A/G-specific adenine glycosylase [Flavihumibacter sediminis]
MDQPFTYKLLQWNANTNKREMPWKGEKDPYKIWLSEIILQQTRVEQGLSYFHRFIDAFPTINDMALAKDEEIFKLWEGLGYYTRARNLLATARYIAFERKGVFPDSYEEILKLKGVGPYTASAIASFAFGLPFAVLDGNVYRVISRYFGINTPTDSPEGKRLFAKLASALLHFEDPASYNQAIMDFGATICKPAQPRCDICPQQPDCQAFLNNMVGELPVKAKSIVRKTRYFYYFILNWKGNYYIRQRMNSDIWKHLHEWVLAETPEALEEDQSVLSHQLEKMVGPVQGTITAISRQVTQQLTHQTIIGRFIRVDLEHPLDPDSGYQLLSKEALGKIAFPRFITRHLEFHPL